MNSGARRGGVVSGCLKLVGIITLAFFALLILAANLSDKRVAEVRNFFENAKNAVTSAESDYRCSAEVEDFAKKNLPSFLKKRKQLAENIRMFATKANELDVQSYKIENAAARKIITDQKKKYIAYATRLSNQAVYINYQLEEIYAISATADSKIYSDKIENIMAQMDSILRESENVKSDIKNMSNR